MRSAGENTNENEAAESEKRERSEGSSGVETKTEPA